MAKGEKSGVLKIDIETILIGSAIAVGAFLVYKHVVEPYVTGAKKFDDFMKDPNAKFDPKTMAIRLQGDNADIEDPIKRKKLLAEIDKTYKNHPQIPKVLPNFLKKEINAAAEFMQKHPHLANKHSGYNVPTSIGLSSI
jgi:hypothetical protein